MTGRRPTLEHGLLDAAARVAHRIFGVDARPYVGAVEERLALGAERYGDDASLDRDNLVELLEETPDVAAYALLELQRLGGKESEEVRDDLLRVVLLGAAADFYARRVRRRLREAEAKAPAGGAS